MYDECWYPNCKKTKDLRLCKLCGNPFCNEHLKPHIAGHEKKWKAIIKP